MADSDDIKRKLREFRPREAAALALRVAARVLPVLAMRGKAGDDAFAYWPRADRSTHVMALLRCYQISIFGHSLPKIDSAMSATFRAAAAAAASAEAAATTVTIRAAYAAAHAAAIATARAVNATSRAGNIAALDAALAATRAARACARDSITDAALDSDLEFLRRNRDMKALLSRPLWPDRMPDEIDQIWLQLIADLRSLNDYHDVWITWYQERLEGRPMHPALEERWALLPDIILSMEPAEINTELMRLWGDFSHSLDIDDSDEMPPEIPENQENRSGFQYQQSEHYQTEPVRSGLSLDGNDPDEMPPESPENEEPGFPYQQSEDYRIEPVRGGLLLDVGDPYAMPSEIHENHEPGFQSQQSEDRHVEPQDSGLASPEDTAEIAAMRGILIKAVDSLVSMTSRASELAWVSAIASDYRDAMTADVPSIDDVYGYGAWLENAYHAMKAQVATKDYPDLTPAAAAVITTIIAIHGPMIASTARGKDLMLSARRFAENQADTAAYKLKAHEITSALSQAQHTATEDVCDEIEQANDNKDVGP